MTLDPDRLSSNLRTRAPGHGHSPPPRWGLRAQGPERGLGGKSAGGTQEVGVGPGKVARAGQEQRESFGDVGRRNQLFGGLGACTGMVGGIWILPPVAWSLRTGCIRPPPLRGSHRKEASGPNPSHPTFGGEGSGRAEPSTPCPHIHTFQPVSIS